MTAPAGAVEPCPSDEALAAAAAGELPEAEAAPLRRHLGACPTCLAVMGALGRDGQGDGDGDLGRAATWDRLPGPGAMGALAGAPLPESFGEFRLLRLLGKGAMGAVYLAEDAELGRPVAIKFIQTSHTRGVRRFRTEARAIARLCHPNVVTLYRVGEALGVPYQVSEYVEGTTLAELPRPMATGEALAIAGELAAGLAAAHLVGVVHRDVKPQNIMRTPAGQVKLLDFGLARLLDALGEGPETRDGAIIGTPRYMAPETLRGAAATPQSDVYAVGVVLHELLTGEVPGLILPPRPPPGVGAPLWAVLRLCLAPEPAARPADAGALQRLLRTAAGPRRRPGRRWIAGAALALVALAILTGGVLVRRAGRAPALVVAAPALRGMVYLPGGAFPMGRSAAELAAECRALGPLCMQEKLDREQPPRTVHLQPFYLDAREVDNGAFAAWLTDIERGLELRPDRDTAEARYVYERPDRVRGGPQLLLLDLGPAQNSVAYDPAARGFAARPGHEALPVVRVTWDGARRYCAGKGKRLPTEAEWERAARGAGARRYPWGDEAPRCDGVSFERDGDGACAAAASAEPALPALHGLRPVGASPQAEPVPHGPRPVGASPQAEPVPHGPRPVGTSPQDRTPEGVLDLGGNVAEWVQDAFLRPLYPPCGACADPRQEPAPGAVALDEDLRLLRGGAWEADRSLLRVSGRSRWKRTEAMTGLGFRCAASP